jgi:hypothetical protein
VCVILVVTGGQELSSFIGLIRTDPGFQADRVVGSVVLPPPQRYETSEKRAAIYKRYLDAVRNLSGVESAGTVSALPFSGEAEFLVEALVQPRSWKTISEKPLPPSIRINPYYSARQWNPSSPIPLPIDDSSRLCSQSLVFSL